MGKIFNAIKRGAENGGRKTTVGGVCAAEYNLSKEDMKHMAKVKLSEKGKGK